MYASMEDVLRDLRIEMSFIAKSLTHNSVLLYSASSAESAGDFILLAIRNSTVYLIFDLGSGIFCFLFYDKYYIS